MSAESHLAAQSRRVATDGRAFSVRAVLCDSAQFMLGEVYVQGAVRRTFSPPGFPFRIPRIGVAAFIYVSCARTGEEHTLIIRRRDFDQRDLRSATGDRTRAISPTPLPSQSTGWNITSLPPWTHAPTPTRCSSRSERISVTSQSTVQARTTSASRSMTLS